MTTRKKTRFTKICKGLYINHEWNMSIGRELMWRKDEGRKWIATWKMSNMYGALESTTHKASFDTMADARAFLLAKIADAQTRWGQ